MGLGVVVVGWGVSSLPLKLRLYPQTCATKRPGGPERCRGRRKNKEKAAFHSVAISHHVRSPRSRRNGAAVTAACTFFFDFIGESSNLEQFVH